MPIEVVWLGHAGVMIRFKAQVLYIDPWKVGRSFPQADIILLTHDHYDHYSPEDIALLKRDATRVAAPMPRPRGD
ncbi:MAG: MBL fold metallo-hydrolase [Desulfomonilia bacterium]